MSSEWPATLVVIAVHGEGAGIFEAAGVPVLYCGVGKLNAAISLTRALARYEFSGRSMPRVVNFGTAGSRRHAAGTLVGCHEFIQRDMDATSLGFSKGTTPFDSSPAVLRFEPQFAELPAAVCASGDAFATQWMGEDDAVVDMEGYALAKTCWLHRAPFCCVKYVSDGADHSAAEDWRRNLPKAAEHFLKLYRGAMR